MEDRNIYKKKGRKWKFKEMWKIISKINIPHINASKFGGQIFVNILYIIEDPFTTIKVIVIVSELQCLIYPSGSST